jgi:hypothetical protein
MGGGTSQCREFVLHVDISCSGLSTTSSNDLRFAVCYIGWKDTHLMSERYCWDCKSPNHKQGAGYTGITAWRQNDDVIFGRLVEEWVRPFRNTNTPQVEYPHIWSWIREVDLRSRSTSGSILQPFPQIMTHFFFFRVIPNRKIHRFL